MGDIKKEEAGGNFILSKDQRALRQQFPSCLMKLGEQPGDVASASRKVNCSGRGKTRQTGIGHTLGGQD